MAASAGSTGSPAASPSCPTATPTCSPRSTSTTGRRTSSQDAVSEQELARNIIGTIGEVDTYRLPDAKGFTSMQRYLIGDTDEARQRCARRSSRHGQADFRRLPTRSSRWPPTAEVVVLGSEQAIKAANDERGSFLKVTKVL